MIAPIIAGTNSEPSAAMDEGELSSMSLSALNIDEVYFFSCLK